MFPDSIQNDSLSNKWRITHKTYCVTRAILCEFSA
jgi:hypothetical protein